ncbi:MAG: hypothetical protein R3F43_25055 [bacterium]
MLHLSLADHGRSPTATSCCATAWTPTCPRWRWRPTRRAMTAS